MGSFGAFEIILIALVLLLIFGAKRIPELARGLGRGIREFKDATTSGPDQLDTHDADADPHVSTRDDRASVRR